MCFVTAVHHPILATVPHRQAFALIIKDRPIAPVTHRDRASLIKPALLDSHALTERPRLPTPPLVPLHATGSVIGACECGRSDGVSLIRPFQQPSPARMAITGA